MTLNAGEKLDPIAEPGSSPAINDGPSSGPRPLMSPQLLTLPGAGRQSPPWRAKASVFEDPRSRALLDRIHQLAPSDATVLLIGETGTGKEIVARHIHQRSRRSGQPFLAVNCGAFSPSLIESELFGHERGAFTGAVGEKAGWFESAHDGTLFLDEIGDLPLALQVKLLRVLQEREVVRLGSKKPFPVNVRLVAATNVRLDEAVAAGTFRMDLFYRIAVARLTIDPLRERPGDILPLARHFLEVYAGARLSDARGGQPTLTAAAEQALLSHPWMGNIRELENAIHYAVLVCRDGRITPADLPLMTLPVAAPSSPAAWGMPTLRPAILPTLTPWTGSLAAATGSSTAGEPRASLRGALQELFQAEPPGLWAELEEMIIRAAYAHAGNNQLKTARLLGLSRSIVRARLLAFGVLAQGERERERDEEEEAPPAPPPRPAAGGHVLVVEDDDAIRASLGELLQDSGYQVSFAENGRAALQVLNTSRAPDVIVLDLLMPVMDGWQFRAIQKDDPRLGLIPVVAISADRSVAAANISAHAYLRKPLDAAEFLRTVEQTHRRQPVAENARFS